MYLLYEIILGFLFVMIELWDLNFDVEVWYFILIILYVSYLLVKDVVFDGFFMIF